VDKLFPVMTVRVINAEKGREKERGGENFGLLDFKYECYHPLI